MDGWYGDMAKFKAQLSLLTKINKHSSSLSEEKILYCIENNIQGWGFYAYK